MRKNRIVAVCIFAMFMGGVTINAQGLDLFETPANLKPTTPKHKKGTINKTDEFGKKQGKWEKNYPNGNVAYTAFFKDDIPIETLTRYYKSGKIKAKIVYTKPGGTGKAELYDEKGTIVAKGNYIKNNIKDSIWCYYTSKGELSAIDEYQKGKKHGTSYVYYANGQASEEINWMDNKREGAWKQYFETGQEKLVSQNKNDKIHGDYSFFYENGQKEIEGYYYNGAEDGNWKFFAQDGTLNEEIEYVKGKPKDMEKFQKRQEAFFKELDENKEILIDPEKLKDDPSAVMQGR